jgi:hypothetical protein
MMAEDPGCKAVSHTPQSVSIRPSTDDYREDVF